MKLDNAILDKFSSQKDGSIKISLITRELSPQQMAEIVTSLNKEIVQVEIPDEIGDTKSPSKRLYDRMLAYYIKKNGKADKFSTWYLEALDQIGLSYLKKIEELENN